MSASTSSVGRLGSAVASRLRRPRRSTLESTFAFLLYLAFAIYITWPWVTDPTDIIYGIVGGDQTSSVAMFGQFADEPQPPWLPGTIDQLNAPDGYSHNWSLHVASFGSSTVLWVMSIVLGPVGAHGFVSLSGFVLSAFATFLLTRHITHSFGAGLVAGMGYGFWQYMYPTGWTWPHYIHLWVFVVLAWRMLVLAERPTTRNGLWAGAAAVLAMTWIEYHLLIGAVLFAVLAVAVLAVWARQRRLRSSLRSVAPLLAVGAFAALVVTAASLIGGLGGFPARSTDESITRSARPLMYVTPGPGHPLFSESTGAWITKRYTGVADTTGRPTASYSSIYIGVPLLLLAIAGAIMTLARLRRVLKGKVVERQAETAVGLTAIATAVVAFAFSAPPHVRLLGVEIPMPYAFVNEITTVFRAASRFSTVLQLAVCLLAAIAVAALIRRLPRPAAPVLVAALLVVLAVDGWHRPYASATRVEPPPIWQLVAKQPPGIVAEFPVLVPDFTLNETSLWQEFHEHPLFNGWTNADERSVTRKSEASYLRDPRAAKILALYGVRYAAIRDPGEGAEAWVARPGDELPGLELIGRAGADALYRVTAEPLKNYALPLDGWQGPEGSPPNVNRWMTKSPATLELSAECDACDAVLRFEASPFGAAKKLIIKDHATGRVLHRQTIAGIGDRVRLPVRVGRRTILRFETDPPPRPISEMQPGNGDPRTVSIYISKQTLIVEGQ